ncbi:MAG: hypothetical protein DRJ65_16660 [Acidobacteria bacterium]|nr:MAG: hypothetical protein DRJ65_16660 [Acidobacteriota bacterium]
MKNSLILSILGTRTTVGLMVASIALVIGGCQAKPPPIKRVILIVVDTLRGDHLSCAGGPVATPNFDAWAARGVRFSKARSHIPITGPSHSSLFTGLLPSDHGVLNNTQLLAEGFETLPEMAQAHGMRTAAFISLGVIKAEFGLDQGFDSYDQRFKYSWYRTADEISDAAIEWVETVDDIEPFLLWTHFSDPHEPYAAPGRTYQTCRVLVDGKEIATVEADGQTISIPMPWVDGRCIVTLACGEDSDNRSGKLVFSDFRTTGGPCRVTAETEASRLPRTTPIFIFRPPADFLIEAEEPSSEPVEMRFSLKTHLSHQAASVEYGHEVEYVDAELGRLLAAIESRGWVDDSLIILTADHGEELGDHNRLGHIHYLYDSSLHVPLIVVAPGHVPEGLVVDQSVSLIDILPTIAEMVGFPVPEGIRGRSLVPLMQSGGSLPARPHVALTARPEAASDLEAIIVDGLKLIRKRETGQVALFDLSTDPGELTDLAPERPDDVERLDLILNEYIASSVARGEWAELDDESRARLEALGYVH